MPVKYYDQNTERLHPYMKPIVANIVYLKKIKLALTVHLIIALIHKRSIQSAGTKQNYSTAKTDITYLMEIILFVNLVMLIKPEYCTSAFQTL